MNSDANLAGHLPIGPKVKVNETSLVLLSFYHYLVDDGSNASYQCCA